MPHNEFLQCYSVLNGREDSGAVKREKAEKSDKILKGNNNKWLPPRLCFSPPYVFPPLSVFARHTPVIDRQDAFPEPIKDEML